MMSSSKTNNKERCIRCTKTILTAKSRLKYTKGARALHERCSRVTRQEDLNVDCAKLVYYGQNAVLCNGCDKWIHKKCVGLIK